jgi:outer membrane immunogenic protein
MKKLLLRGVGLVALAAPLAANAADLAPVYTKAPPPIPVMTWSGFYLGGYGGGGTGFSNISGAASGNGTGNFTISGGIAGATTGFNWQSGSAVFGIEGDGGWAGFSGSAPCANPAFTCSASDRWLSSVRGRLGWAWGANVLLYATGGGAFGDVRQSTTPGIFSGATDKAGWAAGAGIEWMFAPNWSAKLEYMHYDLGTFVCPTGTCALLQPVNERFVVDTGKVGINYHFNWGPVMGRY